MLAVEGHCSVLTDRGGYYARVTNKTKSRFVGEGRFGLFRIQINRVFSSSHVGHSNKPAKTLNICRRELHNI